MIRIEYCDSHRIRLGTLVPAIHRIGNDNFCAACFAGEALGDSEIGEPVAGLDVPGGEETCSSQGDLECRTTTAAEHLTERQLLALLTEARSVRERDWVMLLVTFWHGLRATEVISLTPENFRDGFLTVQRLGRSLRTVQRLVVDADDLLNEAEAIEIMLARHRRALGADGARSRLFPISRVQFYRLMRRHGLRATLPQHLCHPHALRRSIAIRKLLEGGIENTRRYMGHRSITSTLSYLVRG